MYNNCEVLVVFIFWWFDVVYKLIKVLKIIYKLNVLVWIWLSILIVFNIIDFMDGYDLFNLFEWIIYKFISELVLFCIVF